MKVVIIALAALLLPLVGAAAGVSIVLDNGAFKVTGWEPGPEPASSWSSIFAVYADGGAMGGDAPPVFGSYSVVDHSLVFKPSFPLVPGVQYRAVFRVPGGNPVESRLGIPVPPPVGPTAKVLAVYPTADVLPMNQLKLYVEFSQPMQRGGIWSRLHLLDDSSGRAVELPFLEIDQELWDREQKRLTLLFDPGRIKRGVTPNLDMGDVLQVGQSYTLVIDPGMQAANGLPIKEPFRKQFRAGPSVRTGVDLKQWKITDPKAGTRDPLGIDFDRPLDYALLQHVIQVDGVTGVSAIAGNETQWRFVPDQPWKSGAHNLVISMALEDLAGNRIGRPFDVDTETDNASRISNKSTILGFQIR